MEMEELNARRVMKWVSRNMMQQKLRITEKLQDANLDPVAAAELRQAIGTLDSLWDRLNADLINL
jgi:hypothetical protein